MNRQTKREEFLEESDKQEIGLVREFLLFLKFNKKWWLLPIVLVLVLFGLLLILGGTAAGPFIYPLF